MNNSDKNIFFKGLAAGLLVTGPLLFTLLVVFLEYYPVLPAFFFPDNKLDMAEDTISFYSKASKMIDERRTIVTGSSEFMQSNDGPDVPGWIEKLSANSDRQPPVVTNIAGSGITRMNFLLTRLNAKNLFPEKIIIVINPFYATEANDYHKNDLQTYYPDTETMILERMESNPLLYGDEEIRQSLRPRLPFLFLLMQRGRKFISKKIGYPLHNFITLEKPPIRQPATAVSVPDPVWGIDPSFLSNLTPDNIPAMKIKKMLPADLASTHFGRMLQLLNTIADNSQGKTRIKLVILPVNHTFIKKTGLDPVLIDSGLSRQIRNITTSPSIQIIHAYQLNQPGIFYDSIHFNDKGRKILAGLILEESENF